MNFTKVVWALLAPIIAAAFAYWMIVLFNESGYQ